MGRLIRSKFNCIFLKQTYERDKYVNEHKNKYKKLYEDELSDYGFEIEFLY